MVTQEVLAGRAMVASRLSQCCLQRDFYDSLVKLAPLDDEGDVFVLPAAPFESAVVAIHRMERTAFPNVALATVIGDSVRVRTFERSDTVPGSRTEFSVPGGLTVREWFEMIDSGKNLAFTADGAEFAADLSAGLLASA